MFGIGWVEIGVVAVVVFLFMKPEDLPKIMRKFGSIVRQVREFSRAVNRDLQSMARELEQVDEESNRPGGRAGPSPPPSKNRDQDQGNGKEVVSDTDSIDHSNSTKEE